ncbi:MAG TPA: LysM domain-containing protein [Humibacillus sp.]|nr:LysM domain-containing protein [Humibacillus sp.]
MAYDSDARAPRDTTPLGRLGSDPGTRARRIRRILAVPLAIVSTVSVTLGIVQPVEAAPQPPRRQPKAKALRAVAMPAASTVAAVASVPSEVTVADGDTVSSIAERYGLATAEVLALNGLGWSSLIFPGQRLALPGGDHITHEPPPAAVPEIARHIVAPGDTIADIAAEHGLGTDQVLSANGLSRQSLIFPGQAIVLPGPQPTDAAAPAPAAPSPAPEANADADAEVHVVAALPVASVSVRLTDEMRGSARLIIDVGRSLGVPDQGIVTALAAAAQESGLHNLHHGDRDSLGLFQQRPSEGWGTPEEVLDPVRAATAFYGGPSNPNPGRTRGLLDIDGWESMTLTQAAQAVQRSAHPGHYAKWEASARAWLSELG